MSIMDPGVPYGRYYYTRGSSIYNIQDNRILRAGFDRKNISLFVKYDIDENNRMYLDIYNNRFFAEDDGSSSSAHYSDYWFGYADSDNCNAGGTCYSTSGSIPISYDDPFLTAGSKAIWMQMALEVVIRFLLTKTLVRFSSNSQRGWF